MVHGALLAVEGDSIAPLRAGWAARLRQDAGDRAALLGIATLARLTYDYAASDTLYPRLFRGDSLRPDPYAAYARLGRAWSLEERGRSDAAGDEFARARRAARAAGDTAAEAEALIGLAFPRKAHEILVGLEARADREYVSPYHLAYVYTGLGDADGAVGCLERAVAERAGAVYGIRGSFLFAGLQGHAGFRALIEQMKLE